MVHPIVSNAAAAAAFLLVISVSVITANPVVVVPRAAITPPAETADPVVTSTERITTTASAAAPITTTFVDQTTTQDIPVQPTTGAALVSENRTEPPAQQQQQTPENESDKEPSKGLVSFDQRQHGRFNIRADLDNFMIILLPQSTTKSPLLSLGSLGGLGGGGSSSSGFGTVPGSSLFDLFTRKAATASTKRYNNSSRRKYKVKSAMKRKYKEMLKKQALREAAEAAEEEKEAKEVKVESSVEEQPIAATVNISEEQPKKLEGDFLAKDEIEERTSSGNSQTFEKSIQDKYRMDTLEKIQHQLDILIKRVDARETVYDQRPHKDFIEGRTPYRVEIGSLTNEPEPRVDILPSPQSPIPFRQFRTDQALQIGNHGPQPKFFQPWTFPSAAAGDNPINPFGQRQPVMVAFRDGRSLGPQQLAKGNELRLDNSILALPINSMGIARAMDVESNEVFPPPPPPQILSPFSLPNLTDTNTQFQSNDKEDEDEAADAADLENPYLNEGFIDLTDTVHSFDSLNVDNDDKMIIDTPTAQFNQDWDLKLLGATDDCGPDRRRDSYGICQFVQF